jgi:uncharacterized protein YecT (DUF1311 family)
MCRRVRSILSGSILSLAASSQAAAIDCTKAANRTERLICATPSLQGIDSAMAKAYGQLKSSLPAAQHPWLQSSQNNWIQSRADECDNDTLKKQDDSAVVRCLEQQTADRLALLSGARSDAPALAPRLKPVFFHQEGGKGRYEVNLSYPQSASPGLGSLNKLLRQAAEGDQPWKDGPNPENESLGYDSDYRIALQTESFVSVVFTSLTVFGGPYPNNGQFTVNYDLKAGREPTLNDVLRLGAKSIVGKLCKAQLREHYGKDKDLDEVITNKAVEGEVNKISNWVFEPDQIQIEFVIGPHAMGDYACKLSGKIAAALLRSDGPVRLAP